MILPRIVRAPPVHEHAVHACIHRACLVRVQIGVFSRVALAAGAARLLALEPEPANAALWRQNCGGCAPRAALLEAAVVHGAPPGGGGATLVYGKPRTDGVQNTWRHALRGLSHYKEQGPPQEGGAPTSVEVRTVPLFGAGGLLEAGEAEAGAEAEAGGRGEGCKYGEGWSFVKLDCEGAELALLQGFAPGEWRGVRRLVFEWSFTKERRMAVFLDVVARLEAEGFSVWYEGKGNWQAAFDEWPWSADAVVYAARA